MEYWDQDRFIFDFLDPDDEIDLTGTLTVSAPGPADVAGSPWGPVLGTFKVGCKVADEVFGPTDVTGESDMDDGYFYFPEALGKSWGYNRVTCQSSNNSNGPLQTMNLLSFDDIPPELPGSDAVPIPGALWLFGSGLIGLIGITRTKGHLSQTLLGSI